MTISNLAVEAAKGRWDEKRAWEWYDARPWLVGCNFVPSSAINQLEMWQEETFNPKEIDRELGWLADLGMNTMRVFLHDLLWAQDAKGFLKRIDQYLEIAEKHKIGTMLVFFDSCWNPSPVAGPQRAPTPGVHNSYWVQSPGFPTVNDPTAFDKLQGYVTGVVEHFRDDSRVLIWDVWNEPDNGTMGQFTLGALPQPEKAAQVAPLVTKTFQWVRSARPTQPVTSGVWAGDWTDIEKMDPFHLLQLNASDISSFHRYDSSEKTRAGVEQLKRFGRPLLCTEYMARETGSTFEAILSYFKQEKVGAYNWGAVAGKTQTYFPWNSWDKPCPPEIPVWHHDILRQDGSPYDPKEAALIKSLLKT